MGNPSQLVQFAFAAGIDQSQRDEVLEPSAGFLNLENVRQNKRGGISKRNGFTYQTLSRLDATSRGAGYRVFSYGRQTCVIDSTTLDAYSTAASVNVNRGRVHEATLSMLPIPSIGLTQAPSSGLVSYLWDLAICGNYAVVMYNVDTTGTSNDGIWAAVVDIASGTTIRTPELLWAKSTLRVGQLGVYGSYVFAVSADTASNNLQYRYIDTTSASTLNTGWVATANVATDWRAGYTLSVCSLSDRIGVAYSNTSAGTDRMTALTLNTSGLVQTQAIGTASVTPDYCAVRGASGDTLWVAWNQGTTIKACGLNPSTLSSTLATTATIYTLSATPAGSHVIDIAVGASAGTARIFANDSTGARMYMQSITTSAGAVSFTGSGVIVYATLRTSRPFLMGSRYYAYCKPADSTTGRYAVLCDVTPDETYVRPVANVLPRLVAVGQAETTSAYVSGSKVYYPVPVTTAQEDSAGASLAVLDFASHDTWQSVNHARSAFLSGAILSVYDGHRVVENGFVVRPAKPTTSLGGTGLTGTFRYVAVFEHVDKAGNWHASSVSDPSDSVTPANQTVTVTVKPLTISGRITATTDTGVRISIYRTATGGSPPYYLLTSLDNTTSGGTQTYADATADATLTTREKLYAPSLPGVNGSSQDHRAPPGLTYLCAYGGMLVGAQGEDIWYSSQDVSGEGIWFNPVFQVPVSGDGDITGLAAQDGTLFVFKRRAIYAVSGEAPSDNGAVGGLGTPRRLAVDVGCIDARSIVVTSLGVFFQSERGIELLTRSQSVAWIGEQVQDTVASYPVCSAATLDTTANVVYFELAASESSGLVSGNGRTLVYDLSMGQWASVDRRASYAGVADTPAQSAAMIWDGTTYRYAWLQTNGYVRPEQSTYLDSGSSDTWVTMLAETGWVKVSGIQGKQMFNKAMLLAKKSTRADIGLALAYDYDSSYETATVVAANTIDTLSSSLARVQLEHIAHDDAEGQAVRLKVYDATPTGGTVSTGQGATWVALTFDVTPREGAAEVPDTAR